MKFRTQFSLLILVAALAACGGAANAPEVTAEANRGGVFTIHEDRPQQALPVNERTALGISEGVTVDASGRALLQFADLLTVEVLQKGALVVQALSLDEQSALVTLSQETGTFLNNLDSQAELDRRLTVEAGYATITAMGTRFLVVHEPVGVWVVGLEANAADLTVSAKGSTKEIITGLARWVAPTGPPSEAVVVDLHSVEAWLVGVQAGTESRSFAEALEQPPAPQALPSATPTLPPSATPQTATPRPPTPTRTPTRTGIPSYTPTPTPSIPLAMVTANASNCRLGDAADYQRVAALEKGVMLTIEGRNQDSSWWWVVTPTGRHCWISGSTVEVAGAVSSLPIILPPTRTPIPPTETPTPVPTPIPPTRTPISPTETPTPVPTPTQTPQGPVVTEPPVTPTQGPVVTEPPALAQEPVVTEPPVTPAGPAAPTGLTPVQFDCPTSTSIQVVLAWTDHADDETGYRLYRDDVLIATLSANTTVFQDAVSADAASYAVEAYNALGVSSQDTLDLACP